MPGYHVVKRMDIGGMSEAVNLVKERSSGKLFVEKRVSIRGGRAHRTKAELNALKDIKHGTKYGTSKHLNLMQTFKWDEPSRTCSFILEYCDQGSLQDKMDAMQRSGQRMSESLVWHVLLGTAKALAFLHHGLVDIDRDTPDRRWNAISHLDIKPTNIFFSSSGSQGSMPRVVLGDFGCAVTEHDKATGREDARLQPCGTPEWYPIEGFPETVGMRRATYGPPTDIWQLGATIHVMCHFRAVPSRRALKEERYILGPGYSSRLAGAACGCTQDNWQRRPTAKMLVRMVADEMRRRR